MPCKVPEGMAESTLDQWYWLKVWAKAFQGAVDTLFWLWYKGKHLRKRPFVLAFFIWNLHIYIKYRPTYLQTFLIPIHYTLVFSLIVSSL